jgi:hypothetical protein
VLLGLQLLLKTLVCATMQVAQPVVQQLQDTLAYGTRYLLATRPGPNQLVVQVGDPQDYVQNLTAATGFWGLPTAMPTNR